MEAKLDRLFEQATNNDSYPGLAATIIDGKGNQIYHKAFGKNDISGEATKAKYTTSTPTIIFSCTKVVACIAALQLIEQGKLGIDEPASKYYPAIRDVPVFDADGKTSTHPQKKEITIRHLFTHTAGFTYDFFDRTTLQWRVESGAAPANYIMDGTKKYFETPRLFEAGERFHYGINIDYLGLVVEAITGQKLQDYVRDNITKPLGMNNSVPYLDKPDAERLLLHVRGETGKDPLVPMAAMNPPAGLEMYGGGHYLVSTLDDYSKLLAAILNKGTSPTNGATILKKETVETYLFQNQLPESADISDLCAIDNAIPFATNKGRVLADTKLGWSCGFMLNLEDVPGARKKGSGMWAGLGNLYYFIDPASDRAGMVMTSVLPFFDEGVLTLFEAVERAAIGGDVKDGPGSLTMAKVEA